MCVYSSSRRPPFFSVFAALSIRLMIASAASTRHSRLDSPRLMLYRRNHGKGEPVSKRRVGPDYFARGEFGGKISKAFILRDATLIVSESYFCPTFGGEGTKSGFSRCNGRLEGRKKGETGHARSSSVSFFRVTRADSIRDSSGVEATASGGRHTHPSSSVSRPRPRNVPSMRFHLTLQHCCCDHVSLYVASVQLSHASF